MTRSNQTFKDGDIVRIRPEWCNDPRERNNIYEVFNNHDDEKRCCIRWIAPSGYVGLGHSENALWKYLEHA